MGSFLLRRTFQMIVTLWLVSVLGFVIIQLPPGNILTVIESQLIDQRLTNDQIEAALISRIHRQANT